jgi:serine/threonine-protein kinase
MTNGGEEAVASSEMTRPRRWLRRDPRTWITLCAIAAALVLAALPRGGTAPPNPVSRQQVLLWQSSIPPALAPGARVVATQAAVAPDGSSIVFADSIATGFVLKRKLRDASEATVMSGTDGALSPFFSPDGKWVGYLTFDGKLRKVPVGGGGSLTLAEDITGDYRSATWLDDNTIIYAAAGRALKRIPADGGFAADLRGWKRDAFVVALSPLPGSRAFLLTACRANCVIESSIYAYSFAADSQILLVSHAAGSRYSPTGHLIYTDRDGGLFAATFDPDRLALTSGAVSIVEGFDPVRFAMLETGNLLYTTDEASRTLNQLVWVARDGRA